MAAMSEMIADNIMQKIREGVYQEGERLQSERVLAQEYEVSRNVVREALKLLGEKGLVRCVVGKGNYVCSLQEEDIIDKMEAVIDYGNVSIMELLEAREELECVVGKIAMKNINKEEIDILEEICNKMEENVEDSAAFEAYDAKFHSQIVNAAKNRVLKMLTITINNLSDRNCFWGNKRNTERRMRALDEHRRILDALREKDYEAYEAVMREHISHIKSLFQ